MNKFIILMLSLLFLAIIVYKNLQTVKEPLSYITEQEIITKPPYVPNAEEREVLEVVKIINNRNSLVQGIIYDKINIKISEHPIRLRGTLCYEKNEKFRMHVYSVMGEETDMGSNAKKFWFWSKRMNPPTLYYARHEQLYETRLKTPFHPGWFKESLGLCEIDTKNATLVIEGNYYKIIQHRKGIYGIPIIKTTLIDRKTSSIIAHYLHNYQNLIASWEVKELYDGIFPKKIIITWHEENSQTQWELSYPHIYNKQNKIPSENWVMPNKNPRIDLGNERRVKVSFLPQ